jgi:hypothetical protein
VDEVGPLLTELRSRGIHSEVYLPPEAPEPVARELSRYVKTCYGGPPEALDGLPLSGCFVLNDWAPSTRALVGATRAFGGVSFAKVEGVQDFEDVDTGRVRRPYRTADIILGQGQNDVSALPEMDVRVVGSTRLERIWQSAPVAQANDRALINFNFTYNVLTEHQEAWIRAAVRGCRESRVPYEISLHPAQKNVPTSPDVLGHVSHDPFSHSLLRSSVLITRFSTVAFEAMARGVPLIYFNPHGERVPTFSDPQGAFMLVTDHDLLPALEQARSWFGGYRDLAHDFFLRQVDVQVGQSSEARAAAAIISALGLAGAP